MTDTAELVERLEGVVARLEAAGLIAPPGPAPLAAVNPDGTPGNVAAGELIESAWGNAVADTIGQHQARFLRFQGSSALVTTDASGAGVVNFLYPFPALPVIAVTQSFSTGAFGVTFTIYGVNVNGFTFIATTGTGAIYASAQVGVNWIAMSMA